MVNTTEDASSNKEFVGPHIIRDDVRRFSDIKLAMYYLLNDNYYDDATFKTFSVIMDCTLIKSFAAKESINEEGLLSTVLLKKNAHPHITNFDIVLAELVKKMYVQPNEDCPVKASSLKRSHDVHHLLDFECRSKFLLDWELEIASEVQKKLTRNVSTNTVLKYFKSKLSPLDLVFEVAIFRILFASFEAQVHSKFDDQMPDDILWYCFLKKLNSPMLYEDHVKYNQNIQDYCKIKFLSGKNEHLLRKLNTAIGEYNFLI